MGVVGCANVLDYDAISFEGQEGLYEGILAGYECGTMPVVSVSCAQCAQVCGDSPVCRRLAICRMACAADDVACLHDCGIEYVDGMADWKAFHACAEPSCAEACLSDTVGTAGAAEAAAGR